MIKRPQEWHNHTMVLHTTGSNQLNWDQPENYVGPICKEKICVTHYPRKWKPVQHVYKAARETTEQTVLVNCNHEQTKHAYPKPS